MATPDDNEPGETVQYSKVRGLVERLEQAWDEQQDSSKGIDLALFLPAAKDPLRLPSLVELIKADLACRWDRGLPTSLETYIEKFPELGPIDKVPPQLIYEEYRVRARHGSPAPLSQYKSRFPSQFTKVEGLIQTEQSQMTAAPSGGESSAPAATQPVNPLAMLGGGTLVGGHYTLTKRIGTGGFGEVWLGNDIHGNIPKAIKIITRSVESDEAKTELHALEIIKRLNHPYLLRTEGFFAEQERLIVVMELAEGSLREVLKKSKKDSNAGLPVEKLLVYMRHAAEALDYLHEEGIFHRDIKPENILIVGKIAKVADFGLAKLAANRQSTKTNFAGTSAYSSPETWKGRVTPKSDLYSLAVTYGELRLGRGVFKGSTIYEFMIEHLQSQPNLDPMPDAEKAVMLKALAKDPADRYSTCAEFIRALEQAVAGPGTLPSVGNRTLGDNSTPVSKFNTQVSSKTPQNSLGAAPSKPPSWKTAPSHAEIDVAEPEPVQPYRRNRRRKGPNPLVIGVIGLIVVLLGALGAGFLARSSVESKAQDLVGKREYAAALKTIDDSSFLVAPFRKGLRDDVQEKGLEQAEKARKADNLDDLTKITVALVEAFPNDDKAPTILNDSLRKQIPDLIRNEKYADAYKRLYDLPLDVPVKRDQLSEITRKWIERGWEDIDRDDYAAAKQTAADFLRIDPGQKEALALNDLASTAETLRTQILRGQYREIMEKIPRSLPARGQKLANQLRGEVKAAWLKHADSLIKSGNFEAAQQSLVPFSESFKNDAQGNALLKTSLTNLFKGYFAEEKYEDALALLAKTNFEFNDLVDSVKQAWRDAEIKRFKNGDDSAKERALLGLGKLTKQFGSDFELQDDYRKYRGEFVKGLLPQIDASLVAKDFPRMLDTIAKAEPYVQDPAQEAQLKSLQLLALVDVPTPGERKAIERLLKQVMKQPEKAVHLDEILTGVLKLGKADPSFATAVRPELLAFRDVIPEDKLPADYWTLPGMVKSDPTLNATGSRKILADAKKLYNGQEFDQSFRILSQIDIRKESDKSLRSEYYTLYAKLGEKGALTRDQVMALEPAAVDFPDIKPYLSKAMTQTIARSWKTWPLGSETWATRVQDASYAAEAPIVLAFKAEGLLESGKAVDFKLPPGTGDEKAYVDYVRACVAAATNKREDLIVAARALEKLTSKDAWLAPPRRERASKILLAAALEFTKSADDGRRLFESPQEAGQAFAWIEKALQLRDKTLADATTLPWDVQMTLALAAAFKVPPAFEISKTLGDQLFAKDRKGLGGEQINLALSNPSAFASELKTLKGDGQIGVNEVSGMLGLGEAQHEAAPDNIEIAQRQALLYSLKAWALEQASQKNNEAIYSAYSKASKLDPENSSILIAKARFGAITAREMAAKELVAAEKTRLLEKSAKATDAALKKNLVNDESWAELNLERSQLGLDLGNHYYNASQTEEAKEAFANARDFAIKARDAKIPVKKIADAWLALGNAYEDLAHFARVDIKDNYEEAAKALDTAAKLNPEYGFHAGRARYRWANDAGAQLDETAKKAIIAAAATNLAKIAENKKSPYAAEANYWEGFVNWHRTDYAKAYDSFIRSLSLGKKDDAAIWARFSLDAIVLLARSQVKVDPARVQKWSEEAEETYRPLKNLPAFKGAEQPLADVTAEAYMELARRDAEAKDFAKFKEHSARAIDLKHSTKAHEILIQHAFVSKANRAKLDVSPQKVTELYEQALATIEAMPNLSAVQKQTARSEFEKFWKLIP